MWGGWGGGGGGGGGACVCERERDTKIKPHVLKPMTRRMS